MSDSEDANSRRAARPTTPPFRGPGGAGPRPPLTPPAPGAGKLPGSAPGQAGSRTPVAPFAIPPAGSRGRPATPGRDAQRTPSTPAGGARATPATGGAIPEASARPQTPTDAEVAAIPSYGSAPPPSVAATLKSISEFTIVEEPADTLPGQGESGAYEPPVLTPRAGDAMAGSSADDQPATAPRHEGRWVPAPGHELAEDASSRDSGAPTDTEGTEEPLYDNPATELDAVLSAPPFEADHLFDPPAEHAAGGASSSIGGDGGGNDDIIAAAFGAAAPNIKGGPESRESTGHEPVFIGGDPSTRFVAESLEEIARGIRAGEISLPAIDPSADQPAVLAAVLAAILAPRR